MSFYKLKYLYKNGKPVFKHGKPVTKYARGLYSIEEIDALIAEGYIPVATADELDGLRHSSQRVMGSGTIWEGLYFTGLDKKYVQVGDIDLDGSGFSVIGSEFNQFQGEFKGNELSIINLTSAVFSYIGNLSNVSDLRMINCNHTASINFGFLCGINNGNISNAQVYNATFSSGGKSGGLCGVNNGNIDNSYVQGTFTQNSTSPTVLLGSALFVGRNDGVITNSSASGSATFKDRDCGGFVGTNENGGQITGCGCDIDVLRNESVSDRANMGVFCGINFSGTISKCYAKGSIISTVTGNGGRTIGGFVGANVSTINDCYSEASVNNASINTGGFTGANSSVINNSYSTGSVNGAATGLGGLSGLNSGTITNSYYDTDTSGQSDTGKGEPRTTPQLQQGTADSFILPAGGIDLNTLAANAVYTGWSTAIWRFDPKNKYPRLK